MPHTKSPSTQTEREQEVASHVNPDDKTQSKESQMKQEVKTEKELKDSERYPD